MATSARAWSDRSRNQSVQLNTRAGASCPIHRDLFTEHAAARRSPVSIIVSLALHAGLIASVTLVTYQEFVAPNVQIRKALTLVSLSPPPLPIEEIEPLRVPEAAKPEPVPIVEALEPPPPVPEPVKPVEAAPEPPPPAPKIAPPPPRPIVKVGEFASAPTTAIESPTPRDVQTAGFESIKAISPELTIKTTTVGAFESRPAGNPRPGSDVSTGGVIASGFDKAAAPITGTPTARVVSNTGFGSGAAASAALTRSRVVRATGFAETRPVPAAQQVAPRPVQAGTPVEVLYKPTPAYTDEARALKIEGDVVLEVEFGATGQVRVMRVVRGLGHGLDDMAMRAAEQIRFKPAMSGGQPIDFRATVQILFRLT